MASTLHRRSIAVLIFFLSVIFFTDGRVFAFDRQTSAALSSYIMAGIYEKQGNIDLAVAEYKKALRFEDKNSVIHLSLAAAYIKKKEIPQAIEEINRAIALDPEAVEPHAILALLYFSQEKLSEAGKEYERALQNASKLEPKNISIYKSLGVLYLQQKDLKAAESTFLSIIGISPTDYESHFYLANILDEQKKKDAAVSELKKVLELKPDYHQALNYLGYLYVEDNKNLGEAEKLIKKAVELDPENGAYIDSLGWLYFKQGKVKEAVKELERAVILLDDPVIFEHLGDAYFQMKEPNEARVNWEKSLKLNPDSVEVKKKIDSLGEGSKK